MNSVFPIFWLVIIVLSILSKSKTTGGKKTSGSAGTKTAPTRTTPTRGPELPLRGRKAKDDECDYGEANHKYSHESESRIKQLDSYLKAGLIDKKEYAQMLARYRKAEIDFERYQ
jgi:uncharacterized membrane protein